MSPDTRIVSPVFELPIQVRPTDIIGGHVNNVVFLLYAETAREQLYMQDAYRRFENPAQWGITPGVVVADILLSATTLRVSNVRAEYRAGLESMVEPVVCRMWVSRIGRSSFDFAFELRSSTSDQIYAVVHSGMVVIDREEKLPLALNGIQRALLETWLGDPLTFR